MLILIEKPDLSIVRQIYSRTRNTKQKFRLEAFIRKKQLWFILLNFNTLKLEPNRIDSQLSLEHERRTGPELYAINKVQSFSILD